MSQNPPVNTDIYKPKNYTVTNISTALRALITTSSVHDYVVGQLVRLHVPQPYGMRQANELSTYVTDLTSSTSFTTDLDTLKFDTFIASPTYPGYTPPQVTAIGDKNLSTASDGLTIPGSFQQIT